MTKQTDDELDQSLKRLLANVDDNMEFIGTAFNPKENASEKVSRSLLNAKIAINRYAQKMVLAELKLALEESGGVNIAIRDHITSIEKDIVK